MPSSRHGYAWIKRRTARCSAAAAQRITQGIHIAQRSSMTDTKPTAQYITWGAHSGVYVYTPLCYTTQCYSITTDENLRCSISLRVCTAIQHNSGRNPWCSITACIAVQHNSRKAAVQYSRRRVTWFPGPETSAWFEPKTQIWVRPFFSAPRESPL